MRELARFLGYFRRRPRTYAAGLGTIVVSTGLFLAMPGLVRRALDGLQSGVTPGRLLGTAGLIVGLAVADAFAFYFTRRILIGASRDIEYEMRQDLLAHLLALPPSWYRRNRVGDLMSRAVNDLSAVRMMIGPGVMQAANTVVVGLAAIGLMLHVSVPLTLVALSVLPLVAAATMVVGQITHRRFTRIQEMFAEISNAAQESFAGVRLVRAFAREAAEERRFAESNRSYLARSLSLARLNALYFPLLQLLVSVGFAVVLWVGGWLILEGRLSVPRFVEFNLYLMELVWPAIALGWVVNLWQRGSASWNRMAEIWLAPVMPDEADSGERLDGRVELRGLSFAYDRDRPVLSDVSFSIGEGETVAVVGRTGSGKSTLLSLLLRVDDPPAGTIFVGGRDATSVPRPTLRRNVAVVPQETFLFSDTLAANVSFGREGATREEIAAAAEAAGLGPDLERFPRGLDTVVGERGITLSGGQKQRTALARALVSDAPVLVLDDAFSSVDTQTEARILSGLREAARGRTVLLVSHRLSTIRNADRILVLEHGRVAEEGTHEALLARGGAYARLVERQRLEEEVEAA